MQSLFEPSNRGIQLSKPSLNFSLASGCKIGGFLVVLCILKNSCYSLKCSWKDGETHTLYIPTGKMEERESYMSLSSWERLKYAPTEGEIRQREAENMYS